LTEEGRPGERIQKIIANAGLASRRAAERLITEGRVTVDGRMATLGDRARPGVDSIEVDGVALDLPGELVYIALNKPAGVVSTASDPEGRPTVTELVSDMSGGRRVFPVGRLDMDSTGLILLTNDGFLAYRLTHPAFGVPREYIVEVTPVPRRADLASLRRGVNLEDGDTGPARVSLLSKDGGRARVDMIIHSGRKRQIRRSFETLGYAVVTLNRVRIGGLGLGNLRQGRARTLQRDEVRNLYRQTGFEA